MAAIPTVDSLLLADTFELLGGPGGYAVGAPGGNYAGVIVKLNYGYDLSSPQTTVDLLAALSGDGERPYGRRSSNRTISLPIVIDGTLVPTAPGISPDAAISQQFSAVAAALEQIMYLCDADTWRLVWTRRIGADPHLMPQVFDCFRAQPAKVAWGGLDGTLGMPLASLTLTFSALPYGRDDVPQTIDFQNTTREGAAPPSSVAIDGFYANWLNAQNSGFETGIGTWTPEAVAPNCSLAQSSTVAYEGDYSLACTETTNPDGICSFQQNTDANYASGMPCSAGDLIYLSSFIYSTGGRTILGNLRFFTSAGTLIGGAPVSAFDYSVPGNAWTQLSGTCIAPAASAWVLADFRIETPNLNEVTYFDTVVLSDYTSDTASGLPNGWGFMQGGPGAGNTVIYDPTNPGLSSQPWQLAIHGDGSATTATAQSGLWQPAVGGKSYVSDFWMMQDNPAGVSGLQHCFVSWYTAGLTLISSTHPLASSALAAGVPQHIRGSAVAPPGAAWSSFIFQGEGTSGGTPPANMIFYGAGGTAAADAITNAPLGSWTLGTGTTLVSSSPWQNAQGGTTGDYSAFGTGQGQGPAAYTAALPDIGIEGLTAVTFWAGFASALFFPMWCRMGGVVQFTATLTDNLGNTVSAQKLWKCYGSDDPANPKWTKIRIPLPHTTGFNWADLVSYTITVTNRGSELWFTRLYLCDFRAEPPADLAYSQPSVGSWYELHEVAGETRSQLSIRAERSGTATWTDIFGKPGSWTWQAPSAVTSVASVVAIGPGQAGSIGATAAGGSGGGSGVATAVAVTPGKNYPVVVGRGGWWQTGFATLDYPNASSSFQGDTVTVTGPMAGTGAGAAGTPAGFAGGAGDSPGSGQGGGGGGAGQSGAGGTSTSSTGGAAGTGTPAGGAGTNGVVGTSLAPTGPGAGSGAGSVSASPGADGEVYLSFTGPNKLQTLILHRPGFSSPREFVPFCPQPLVQSPLGPKEVVMPAAGNGVPARFNGTYSVVVVPSAWGSSTSIARQITVTVTQYEEAGGASYQTSITASITPASLVQLSGTPAGTGFAVLGEITLPANLMAPDNTESYFTVLLSSQNVGDTFQDVLFLDTMGSTVIIQSPTGYANLWVDEPTPQQDIGYVLGGVYDRASSVSLMDRTQFSGPPLDVDPYGNPGLLVYSMEATPLVQGVYFPRHFLERTLQ